MARPSKFTQGLADKICERIADGESLRAICSDEEMPNRATVFRWLALSDADDKIFSDQYAHARETQADTLFDEILEIADNGTNDTYVDDNGNPRTDQDVIARSRLRVDSRKWMAGKLRPKKYGEKLELSGDAANPLHVITKIERVIVNPAN